MIITVLSLDLELNSFLKSAISCQIVHPCDLFPPFTLTIYFQLSSEPVMHRA